MAQRSLLSFFGASATPQKKPSATLGVSGAAATRSTAGKAEPATPATKESQQEHESERKRESREEDQHGLLQDETVVKKNRVAVEDDLELFDDELAWEEVTPKQTAQQTPATNAVSSSLASSSISSTPASFSAFSRGAPLLATPQSGQARRALLAADFGLNVKEEMAEWKQNKCPWLDDIRDANLRRPNDEGYDKSTLHIPKKLMNELTIPQQQYWNIKCRYFDWVVWFQVGSFYEVYAEDAMLCQELLGLKIHSKGAAGVPVTKIDGFVERLVSLNCKVVVVTQSDEMEGSNKKRIVTEIVSAGTVLEPKESSTGSIFIMSIAARTSASPSGSSGSRIFSVTFCDLSLLESFVAHFEDDKDLSMLLNVLEVVSPKEVVFCASSLSQKERNRIKNVLPDLIFSSIDQKAWWGAEQTRLSVLDCLKKVGAPETVSELLNEDLCAESFGGLLQYLITHHSLGNKASLLAQSSCSPYVIGSKVASSTGSSVMVLDATTLKNLDVFVCSSGSSRGSTLWSLLNFTSNPMGTRMLRRWITQPLCDLQKIAQRQKAIADILEGRLDEASVLQLQKQLKSMGDVERVLCRIHAKMEVKVPQFVSCVNAFKSLAKTLSGLKNSVGSLSSQLLTQLLVPGSAGADCMPDFASLLDECTSFWFLNKEQQLEIKDGFDTEEMVSARQNLAVAQKNMNDLLKRAQEKVNSKAVWKINGSDYLFEIPAATKNDVIPKDWKEEKVSAKTKRRFGSSELRQKASDLTEAQAVFNLRSKLAVAGIVAKFAEGYETWRRVLRCCAAIDCLFSLATASKSFGDCCFPEFGVDGTCELIEVRHPVLERAVSASGGSFIPNNIVLQSPVALITGPNSGGKSTILRTVAVTSLLAQLGCKVAASSARLPLVDRIFTRIGARDDIMQGKSTFMIEMEETAAILNQATSRSLLILDELGRGTSTNDGYAIAWAVLRRLTEICALSLFATHYHGLCRDFASHPKVSLRHVSFCKGESDRRDVVFLYQLNEGPAGGSYGLNVAQMAGLPSSVIDRAEKIVQQCQEARMFDTNTDVSTFLEIVRVLHTNNDANLKSLLENI